MMREIKFRGKTIAGDWIVGDLVHHDWSFNRVIPLGIRPAGCSALAVIPETVGQYTSLKDKDGKEIYEGDIISDHVGIGYVKYDRFAAFCVYYGGNTAKWFVDYNLSGEMESIEIIGNIHDNPELLKEV